MDRLLGYLDGRRETIFDSSPDDRPDLMTFIDELTKYIRVNQPLIGGNTNHG